MSTPRITFLLYIEQIEAKSKQQQQQQQKYYLGFDTLLNKQTEK